MKSKLLFFFAIVALFLFNLPDSQAQEKSRPQQPVPRLLFFYSLNCHACQKVKTEIMPAIEKDFSGRIKIEYLDTAYLENYKFMLSLKEKYKCQTNGVPTIFLEGRILVGYPQIASDLRNIIMEVLSKDIRAIIDKLPGIDLVKHFLSFGALTIIVAGLIDGINPCAFTVIVFFISFLALQGYKKKELVIIGLAFILAVFMTYVFIGLGIFRFLYALRQFYIVARIVNYLIAVFCFILAVFALYDLWIFKKTKNTEGMKLQLPKLVKNRIHSVIGRYYRKPQNELMGRGSYHNISGMVVSAFVTGFLVSLLEAVCTGQLYLPTLAFMLKNATLRLRAFGYLLLYNFMFIIPLFTVLLLALFGTTSAGFSRFMNRHMMAVKLSMAVLFLGLGVLILISA